MVANESTLILRIRRTIASSGELVFLENDFSGYDAAAGYLRAALRVSRDDGKLQQKRQQYELLGKW